MLRAITTCVLLAAAVCVTTANKNPCHDTSGVGSGVSCKVVRLPPGLCDACSLDTSNAPAFNEGNFNNCADIYDLRSSKCQKKLKLYAKRNSCDPVRGKQIPTFIDLLNKGKTSSSDFKKAEEKLDYFMYSVCEQCCDCIPMGHKGPSAKRTLSVTRGNCPAHAVYDICQIYPQVGHFMSTKKSLSEPNNVKSICGDLGNWLGSSAANNWPTAKSVSINNDIKDFLKQHNKAAQCKKKGVFNKCWILENNQKRI